MAKKNFGNVTNNIFGLRGLLETDTLYYMEVSKIKDNPYQPRKKFDEEKLQELAESIKEHGVIQPIIVRKENNGDTFLVAGERRLRAAKLNNFPEVPVIYTTGNALEISLIENLQRENLDPFEEAEAFKTMIDEYEYTQENLAKVVGKSRSMITRSLSLNNIPDELKDQCSRVNIPKRTLFEIAKQKSSDLMSALVEKIINFDLKAEDIQQEAKRQKKERVEKPKKESSEVALKKIKAFKKYVSTLESEIDENYSDSLKEIVELQRQLTRILSRFEK